MKTLLKMLLVFVFGIVVGYYFFGGQTSVGEKEAKQSSTIQTQKMASSRLDETQLDRCAQEKKECLQDCPKVKKEIPTDPVSVITMKTLDNLADAMGSFADNSKCRMGCDKKARECREQARRGEQP